MQCHEMIEQMDDWCDQRLTEEQARACARHLEHCGDCRLRLHAEQRRREVMATMAVPEPDEGFEQRMLAGAAGGNSRRWSSPAVGAAMAACLVVGLMVGQWMTGGDQLAEVDTSLASEEAGPATQATASGWDLDEPVVPVMDTAVETVRLAFSAGEPMKNVTLTLEMPAHMELASFPGERTISWQVDLEAGQNLLSLPVRNLFPGEGELVAHLDDGERRKTFRTPVGTDAGHNRGES
ncbi:MAG: zf-HC2 domain-containing protein [Halomonadaceae bacterium]|nr:MAG: zf-HC2 domain-containing protein [Halomonadaceae bacterium]